MQLVEKLTPSLLDEMSELARKEKEDSIGTMAPAAPKLLTLRNNYAQILMARSKFGNAEEELLEVTILLLPCAPIYKQSRVEERSCFCSLGALSPPLVEVHHLPFCLLF